MYALFFAVPLVGWAYSSALGYPLVWFGVLPLPDWVPQDRELARAIKPWHARAAWLLGLLVLLHVAGRDPAPVAAARRAAQAHGTMAAMKRLLILPLLLAASLASAQTVRPDGSEIRFVTRQMGVPVEGRFLRWQAQVTFDPAAAGRTGGLHHRHPQHRLRGRRHRGRSGQARLVRQPAVSAGAVPLQQREGGGHRALRRGRHAVDQGPVARRGGAGHAGTGPAAGQGTASGSFTLKRMDFRLGEGEWADVSVVADEVQVRFKLLLTGLAAP
jgi:hypothetical protein